MPLFSCRLWPEIVVLNMGQTDLFETNSYSKELYPKYLLKSPTQKWRHEHDFLTCRLGKLNKNYPGSFQNNILHTYRQTENFEIIRTVKKKMIITLFFFFSRMKFSKKASKNPFSWSPDDQSLQANIWTVAILLVVPLAIGSNYVTTGGTFVFDDRESVLKNEDVYNLSIPITNIFAHDFWGCNITSNLSHKSYRPLTIMAFR